MVSRLQMLISVIIMVLLYIPSTSAQSSVDARPSNDVCSAAIGILPTESTVGKTASAVYDGYVTPCTNVTSTAPALWYKVQGTGATMRAETTGTTFNTVMSIIQQDTCTSSTPKCTASSGDPWPWESSVVWKTENGKPYFIRVSGYSKDDPTGSFRISLTAVVDPPPNDVCSGVMLIVPTDIKYGNTSNAVYDGYVTPCKDIASTFPALWYRVQGTGETMKAETTEVEFNTVISIIQQDTCTSSTPKCTAWSGDPWPFVSSVVWPTENGKSYFIRVSAYPGVSGYPDDGGTGGFSLSLTTVASRPANDVCSGADPIAATDIKYGNTIDAAYDGYVTPCNDTITISISPALWYRVQGTGATMKAQTFDVTSNTLISIIEQDTCTSSTPKCKASSGNPWQSSESSVVWQTETGKSYLIRVASSNDGGTGSFRLSLTTVASRPANDVCSVADPMVPTDIKYGNTTDAAYDGYVTPCKDIVSFAPALWYRVQGTGATMKAQTFVDFASSSNVVFSIIEQDTCTSSTPKCTASSGDAWIWGPRSVVWQTEVGKSYLIRVSGYAIGFSLSLSTVVDPPVNDVCLGSELIVPDETKYGNTTDVAYDRYATPCPVGNSSSPALWYRVQGTGGWMTAVISSASFATAISIIEKACDGSSTPQCIASNQRGASWQTVNGVEYHIRVGGAYADSFGDFQLSLSVAQRPLNQACGGAIPISPNDIKVGDTAAAVYDGYSTPCSEDASSTSPALWYLVEAVTTPVIMRADTCDFRTNMDTVISIIQQNSCTTSSTPKCTASNDDSGSCSPGSTAVWQMEPGATYYIRVSGFGSAVGMFGLSLSVVVDRPTNDRCTNAISISPGRSKVGSNVNAVYDENAEKCYDHYGRVPGLWYSVVGTGGLVKVDTCNDQVTTIYSYISIIEGACDGTCLTSNYGSCWSGGVSWQSTKGENYYIFVSGTFRGSDAFGTFSLHFATPPPLSPELIAQQEKVEIIQRMYWEEYDVLNEMLLNGDQQLIDVQREISSETSNNLEINRKLAEEIAERDELEFTFGNVKVTTEQNKVIAILRKAAGLQATAISLLKSLAEAVKKLDTLPENKKAAQRKLIQKKKNAILKQLAKVASELVKAANQEIKVTQARDKAGLLRRSLSETRPYLRA